MAIRTFHLSLFVFSLLCLSSALSVDAQTTQEETGLSASVLPQAEPVYNLLMALEISDFDLYLSAFSPGSLETFGLEKKKHWPKFRKMWKKQFKGDLGSYQLEDLRFVVDRDLNTDARTVVYFVHKGKRLHGINVSKVAGKWKIIEL